MDLWYFIIGFRQAALGKPSGCEKQGFKSNKPTNKHYQLRLVVSADPFPETKDLAVILHTLVTSSLDYWNGLRVGLPLPIL